MGDSTLDIRYSRFGPERFMNIYILIPTVVRSRRLSLYPVFRYPIDPGELGHVWILAISGSWRGHCGYSRITCLLSKLAQHLPTIDYGTVKSCHTLGNLGTRGAICKGTRP